MTVTDFGPTVNANFPLYFFGNGPGGNGIRCGKVFTMSIAEAVKVSAFDTFIVAPEIDLRSGLGGVNGKVNTVRAHEWSRRTQQQNRQPMNNPNNGEPHEKSWQRNPVALEKWVERENVLWNSEYTDWGREEQAQ
jgi:hypothetical protein